MSIVTECSGIATNLDYVMALPDTGFKSDWHGKTREKQAGEEWFPKIEVVATCGVPGSVAAMQLTGEARLWCEDVSGFIARSYDPATFVPFLPQQALAQIDTALVGVRYRIVRCGMLFKRSKWFICVELTELSELSRDGEKFYLQFSGGLDGSLCPEVDISHIRTVCWNTLRLARSTGKTIYKWKQTKNSALKWPLATELIESAAGVVAVFNAAMKAAEETPMKLPDIRSSIAGAVVRWGGELSSESVKKNGESRDSKALGNVDEMTILAVRGDGNAASRGTNAETTVADALNGVTQFYTRGGGSDSKKSPWLAIQSSEFGGNADKKAEFFAWVTDAKERKSLVADGRAALKQADAVEFVMN